MNCLKYVFCFMSFITILSCNQDPIFYLVSKEVAPKEPTIPGSPSKIIKSGDSLFAANGKLWQFKNNNWSSVSSLTQIYDIAAVGSEIYILQIEEDTSTVYKHSNSSAIANTSGYDRIQSIFGANSSLYAAARQGSSEQYATLRMEGSDFKAVRTGGAAYELRGVSGSYFATATAGVFNGPSNPTPVEGTKGIPIISIFSDSKMGGAVVAVASNALLVISGSSATKYNKGISFSGAICIWQRSGYDPLLLVGINGGVNNYGYREFKITSGKVNFDEMYVPGDLKPNSSVFDMDKYKSQLEKYVIRSIIQPDNLRVSGSSTMPVLFASTQKDGLWSYRADSDNPEGVWNAE